MISDDLCEQLYHKVCSYILQKKNDKEEKFLKDKPKKNKSGEVSNGAINARLFQLAKELGVDKSEISKIEKSKKGREQTSLAFHQERNKNVLKLMSDFRLNNDLANINSEYSDFIQKNENNHIVATWLSEWTPKAKDISFATHVGKLTHSSSKSSSILDASTEVNYSYLTTSAISNLELDTASANAASLPIADVLKTSVGDVSVLDCIKNNDFRLFELITSDRDLIVKWVNNLKQAYDSLEKQSYFLSKQIYFPLGDGGYHLLLPLTSSSIAHKIHFEIKGYWSEEQFEARKRKKEGVYHSSLTVTYPNKASLSITQSNHSNASSLNGKRGGKLILLPSLPPPTRSKMTRIPLDDESIFNKYLASLIKNEVSELKKYLLVIKGKKISFNKPDTHIRLKNKIVDVVEGVTNYILSVNEIAEMNWTNDCFIPIEQQLLFEPWREDEKAIEEKKRNIWIKTVSQSFAYWLNNQLLHKRLNLTPVHERLWAEIIETDLRSFIATQEVKL